MNAEGYPVEITPAEAAAGFKKLKIQNIERWAKPGETYDVVGYPLAASDVLIKHIEPHFGHVAYSHRRWGISAKNEGAAAQPGWHTLSGPHADPALAAGQCVMDLLEESNPKIIGIAVPAI